MQQFVAMTGGSAGRGRASARVCAANGYATTLIARGVERRGEARAELAARELASTPLWQTWPMLMRANGQPLRVRSHSAAPGHGSDIPRLGERHAGGAQAKVQRHDRSSQLDIGLASETGSGRVLRGQVRTSAISVGRLRQDRHRQNLRSTEPVCPDDHNAHLHSLFRAGDNRVSCWTRHLGTALHSGSPIMLCRLRTRSFSGVPLRQTSAPGWPCAS